MHRRPIQLNQEEVLKEQFGLDVNQGYGHDARHPRLAVFEKEDMEGKRYLYSL